MYDNAWNTVVKINPVTGAERVRHLRMFTANEKQARVYTEVYHLGGRLYWSAHVHIPYRPDLSKLAFGMYADVPGALAVAKMRASRHAKAALRKAGAHVLEY
jgi:hypothetical protein